MVKCEKSTRVSDSPSALTNLTYLLALLEAKQMQHINDNQSKCMDDLDTIDLYEVKCLNSGDIHVYTTSNTRGHDKFTTFKTVVAIAKWSSSLY